MSPAGQSAEVLRLSLWPSTEHELILTAAIGPDAAAIEAFRRWDKITNFQENFDTGTFRLLPLVYKRMHALGISATTMPMLKSVYRYAWCSTQALFHNATPALSMLRAQNIELLLLKGVPLLGGYYKDIGLRPMNDIDVVVRRKDLRKSIHLLEKTGWSPVYGGAPPEQHFDYHQSMEFRNAKGSIIDLHCHFLYDACSPSADTWFWAHSVSSMFMDIDMRYLDATALLFHVTVHGMRPNIDPPIRWMVDAMMILSHAEQAIRWPEIVAFARVQRLTHRLHLGFSYLANKFHAPIPAFVLAELNAQKASWPERMEDKFLLDTERPSSLRGKIGLILSAHARRSQDKSGFGFLAGLFAFVGRRLQFRWKALWRRSAI